MFQGKFSSRSGSLMYWVSVLGETVGSGEDYVSDVEDIPPFG